MAIIAQMPTFEPDLTRLASDFIAPPLQSAVVECELPFLADWLQGNSATMPSRARISCLWYTDVMATKEHPMPSRARKTIATTLPSDEIAALDRVRKQRSQSRAELMRDAIRWYVASIGRLPPAEDPLADEIEAIREGQAQIARGECVRLEDLQHELGLPTK